MALKDGLVKLKAFAAAPWFPVLVGFLSGANLFLLVMSAPLVILYCSAVLANPKRFWMKKFSWNKFWGWLRGGAFVWRFFVNLDLLCVFALIGKIGVFSLGWFYTAVANAVGTVLGCLVLIILMEERGMDFIKESFPVSCHKRYVWEWCPPMNQMTSIRLGSSQLFFGKSQEKSSYGKG